MHNFCFSPITACYNKVSNRCARRILFESSFQSLIFQQSDILLDETKFILRNPQNSKATNFQPFFLFQSFKAIETNQSNRDVHLKTVSKKKEEKNKKRTKREDTWIHPVFHFFDDPRRPILTSRQKRLNFLDYFVFSEASFSSRRVALLWKTLLGRGAKSGTGDRASLIGKLDRRRLSPVSTRVD